MTRSVCLSAFITVLMLISSGCTEAEKKIEKMGSSAIGDIANKAKGAVKDGAGISDLMGKATEALSSVEGGSEMLKQVTAMFGKATTTIQGVKDEESATAAVPELEKLTESLGGLTEMYEKLPDAAKKAVSGVFTSSLDKLKPVIDKAMGIPGVEAVLKPAIDALMSKLDSFKA